MAYKFQLGAATMSGSLKQEGNLDIEDNGVLKVQGSNVIDASRNITAVSLSASNTLRADGATRLDGTLQLNGVADAAATVADDSFYFLDGDGLVKREAMSDYASSVAGAGLTAASGVLAVGAGTLIDIQANQVDVDLSEASAATIVDGDYLVFLDGGSGGTAAKGDTSDFADLLGGAGIAVTNSTLAVVNASNGGLTVNANDMQVNLNDLAAAAVDAANDSIAIIDATDSGSKKESIADLMDAVAGVGLKATSGVLEVRVSGSVIRNSDKISITGSIAGTGLTYGGGVNSISELSIDLPGLTELAADGLVAADEMMISDGGTLKKIGVDNLFMDGPGLLSAAAISVSADHFMFLDGAANGDAKIESIADLMTGVAGTTSATALMATDGVLALDISELSAETLASGDAFVFNDATDDGLHKVTADNLMTKGLPLLTEAAITVADDYVVFLDGGVSGDGKKEKWADIVTAIAGAGLSATNGVLSTDSAATPNSIGDAAGSLEEGFNWGSTTFTADRIWTLPVDASSSAGDIVYVKAPDSLGGNDLTITGSGAQTMDGASSLEIESDGGAVSLVYVGSSKWKIF